MLDDKLSTVFAMVARYGVVHRDEIRGYEGLLRRIVRSGFVVKVYKKGKVFYELTEKALGALEDHRKMMVYEIGKMAKLLPKKQVYKNLLGDLRFVDERSPEAEQFVFLGDWQLGRPVVPGQLELAKLRYYFEHEKT